MLLVQSLRNRNKKRDYQKQCGKLRPIGEVKNVK